MSLKECQSAIRRAASMARYHGWQPEFDTHPLAACIDNYTACIDAEMEADTPDFLAVLGFVNYMARRINAYCDSHRIVGDDAAEYWLERFLWRANSVACLDKLRNGSVPLSADAST